MPTYDYVCENGHRFELFQSMKDASLDRCTQCEAPARRVIGAGGGFIFKGGGFYSTDYRSKQYKDQAKSESGGGAAADKPASGGGKASEAGTSGSGEGGGTSGEAAKPSGGKASPKSEGGSSKGGEGTGE